MKHPHISTVPDGYLIRITRAGVVHQRFISNGREDALGAAIAARDELLAGLPIPPYERSYPICHTKSRSNTGHTGICYSVETKPSGATYERIAATVRIARNVTKGRTFLLTTYGGYARAVRAALAWREALLEKRKLQLAKTQ